MAQHVCGLGLDPNIYNNMTVTVHSHNLLHDEAIHQRWEVCNIKSNAHFGVH